MLGLLAFAPVFAQISEVPIPQNDVQIAPFQLSPIHDKAVRLDGGAESTNWSGYAVTGSGFTSVSSSWIVPTTTCNGVQNNQYGYAAIWVGIDGYISDSVEQSGTLGYCLGNRSAYYAWFEFYPNPMMEITSVPVNPGNSMTATVTYGANGRFTLTITNNSTGRSYTASEAVNGAARSSAEWIVEAPCCTNNGGILPLADFGTATFTNASAAESGTSGTIASFGSNAVEVNKLGSNSSPQLSNCSLLNNAGNSFSCTWQQ
jgi:Peptidase A4 family